MQQNQIKAGAILSYVQMALSIAVGLIYTPVMIRLLGQSEYGLYSAVTSVISMLYVLHFGFGSAYQRYYSKYKKEGDQIKVYRLNGLFLIIFSVLGLIALGCGIFFIGNIELIFDSGLTESEYKTAAILLKILVVQLAIFFPAIVLTTIISAHERYIFAKSLQILKTLRSPCLTLPLLLLGYKSVAVVSVSLIITIFCDLISLYYVLFRLKEKFKFGKIEQGLLKALIVYIFFIALHLITDQINWNVDKILLGRFCGTEVVAIYSVGYSIYSYMIYLGTPISSLFIPKIHRIAANYDLNQLQKKDEYTKIFVNVGSVQYVLIGCIISGFILFGRPFIALWTGEEYLLSYWVTLLLMIPGSVDLIQVIGIEIQRAQNQHKFRGIVYIVMAFINIAMSIPLCIYWGAIGSAVGTAISLILVQGFIINIYLHKKRLVNIVAFWKKILRLSLGILPPLIIGELVIPFFNLTSWSTLLISIICYCTIYVLSMWFIAFDSSQRNWVLKTLKVKSSKSL